MTFILGGLPEELPSVEVNCPCDEFENAIRKFGIINACEWFGHLSDSEFTKETIQHLRNKYWSS